MIIKPFIIICHGRSLENATDKSTMLSDSAISGVRFTWGFYYKFTNCTFKTDKGCCSTKCFAPVAGHARPPHVSEHPGTANEKRAGTVCSFVYYYHYYHYYDCYYCYDFHYNYHYHRARVRRYQKPGAWNHGYVMHNYDINMRRARPGQRNKHRIA